MSLPAFYLPADQWAEHCSLGGDEARHAHALRLAPGDEVILLNGEGESATGRIEGNDKKNYFLTLLRRWYEPAPKSKAIIAMALSKGIRRGFFMEKAAELGAWGVWLWQAQRSQGQLTEKLVSSCAGQLRAGAKQCHNPWFPRINAFAGADQLADGSADCEYKLLPWEEMAGESPILPDMPGRSGITIYVIGPEGGIAKEEKEVLASAGFITVGLGRRVLRCETAATLCLGLHWWASQLPGNARKGSSE